MTNAGSASFIPFLYLNSLERKLLILSESVVGVHTIPFISEGGRNIILAKIKEDGGKLDFNFVWGVMHGRVRELFREEKYKIKKSEQITSISINEDGCLFRFLLTSAPNLSFSVNAFRWYLGLGDLVSVIRKWLETLDSILLVFEEIMGRLNISLGRHIRCSCGGLKFENGKIIYSLFMDDCLVPRGEIMFGRDKASIGIGFGDLLFGKKWWYQMSGLGEPMESYIRSMIINGDV
jgi:hypothetical protein